MKYLSKKEVNEAIQKAAKKSQEYYVMFLVLAGTGCRVTELINIRTQDILDDENQIIIRGKGDYIRNVDVTPELIMQLQLYIKNKRIHHRSRLFKRTRQGITLITKRISGVSAHAFRHTYAIDLLRKTKNIRYVQKQLGHSSLATTQIYLQFMDFEEEKNKLGELYA